MAVWAYRRWKVTVEKKKDEKQVKIRCSGYIEEGNFVRRRKTRNSWVFGENMNCLEKYLKNPITGIL